MKRSLLFMGIWAVLAGCAGGGVVGEKQEVVVSFYPLAFVAEQLLGDAVVVRNVTPAGVDPHDALLTVQDRAAIERAAAVLYVGGGFDPVFDELAQGERFVRVMDAVRVRVLEEADEHEHEGVNDPHFWLSPVEMRSVVVLVAERLVHLMPEHAERIVQRRDAMLVRVDALDAEYRRELMSCTGKTVVVTHDTYGYLAREYGFMVLPISGIDPKAEPSAEALAGLMDAARAQHVGAVLFEGQVSPKLAELVAENVGVRALTVHTLHGLTAEEMAAGKDYVSVMREQLPALRAALGCGAGVE